MVPLGTLVGIREITGPARVVRYHLYPSAEVNGNQTRDVSSGQVIAMMEDLAHASLPASMGFEWTELTYQQILPATLRFTSSRCACGKGLAEDERRRRRSRFEPFLHRRR